MAGRATEQQAGQEHWSQAASAAAAATARSTSAAAGSARPQPAVSTNGAGPHVIDDEDDAEWEVGPAARVQMSHAP